MGIMDEVNSRPPRPVALPVQADNIPAELTEGRCWVLWRYEWRGTDWTKVPRQPGDRCASTTNRKTWSSFDEVMSAYKAGGWDGVGRVVTEGYVGPDLDDACAEDGSLKPWGRELVVLLDTYTERSPGGTGVKMWARGQKNASACRRPYADGVVEVYDHASPRFFTVTGQRVAGTPAAVNDRQGEIDRLCELAFPERPGPAGPATPARGPRPALDLTDEELLEKARASKNGGWVATLYDRGDTSGHDSHSEADLSLCNQLAFWFGKDPARMERVFSASALGRREKWTGRPDYRDRTIRKAIEGTPNVYEPPPPRPSVVVNGQPVTGGRKKATGAEGHRLQVGPLVLLASSPSATACRLSVRVSVAVKGKTADWLTLTASSRSRKDAAARVYELAARHSRPGDGPGRDDVDNALGELLAWAAGEAERKAAAPPVAAVLRAAVVPPLRLAFRTAEGHLWSEAFGRAVNRYEFATMCDDATLCALEGCGDAPPERSSLIFRARQEMATLFATLERELPDEAGADLGESSERAKQFREAVRQLWVINAIGEVEEGRHGQERNVQTCLAAKARKLVDPTKPIDPAEPWRPVHRNHLAWARVALLEEGEVQAQLAMRADLAVQVNRRPLPGCAGDGWLLAVGTRYGAFRPADGTARLTDGHPIAVLEHSIAESLLASPDNLPSPQTSTTRGDAFDDEAE